MVPPVVFGTVGATPFGAGAGAVFGLIGYVITLGVTLGKEPASATNAG